MVTTGDTIGCRSDNRRCHRWRQFNKFGITTKFSEKQCFNDNFVVQGGTKGCRYDKYPDATSGDKSYRNNFWVLMLATVNSRDKM